MIFSELDKKLRIYETAHDFCVPPKFFIIARIDGRSFTRLTKEKQDFERPFDEKFRDLMIETTRHLMGCGFKVIYAYTESDEISLLFDLHENAFSRKTRKYNSILAGEASACFTLLLGDIATFDCRISQLPGEQEVIDYFRWRNEDAHRNALNAHCYWFLRKTGYSANDATREIEGKSTAYKNELLFRHDINYNDLPAWQKRGVGLYYATVEKKGLNPLLQTETTFERNEIIVNTDLPKGDAYNDFISAILKQNTRR